MKCDGVQIAPLGNKTADEAVFIILTAWDFSK
jgi:hypothetical protein